VAIRDWGIQSLISVDLVLAGLDRQMQTGTAICRSPWSIFRST